MPHRGFHQVAGEHDASFELPLLEVLPVLNPQDREDPRYVSEGLRAHDLLELLGVLLIPRTMISQVAQLVVQCPKGSVRLRQRVTRRERLRDERAPHVLWTQPRPVSLRIRHSHDL